MSAADRFWLWVAGVLPRRLAYWCFVRVAAHASFVMPRSNLPELTVDDVVRAWDVVDEGYDDADPCWSRRGSP